MTLLTNSQVLKLNTNAAGNSVSEVVVDREGKTTVDMANGAVQRVQPYPETIALLEKLGAKNNHKCVSC